jgi:glycosyltransferase involved in cell wall biosynthesis
MWYYLKMQNKILSIVIPVFNEENTIKNILDQVINAKLPQDWGREIIVVNDNSTDNTLNILLGYGSQIKLINRTINSGKGAALKDGFKSIAGDYVIVQDADLEYSPNDYMKLLEPIVRGGADVVFGSRNMGQNNVSYGFFHYYGGMVLTKMFNLMFGSRLTDFSTCYKVFHKKYINKMLVFKSNNFAFDVVEMTYVLVKNSNIVEVPISYNPRNKKQGKKLKIKDGLNVFWVIIGMFIKNLYVKKSI